MRQYDRRKRRGESLILSAVATTNLPRETFYQAHLSMLLIPTPSGIVNSRMVWLALIGSETKFPDELALHNG